MEERRPIERHRLGDQRLWSVAWSPDGRWLAVASADHGVYLGRGVGDWRRLAGHRNEVNTVAWSPDGRRLASGADDHSIRIWDPATSAELARLTGHEGWVWSVAFSPDGRRLASGCGGGRHPPHPRPARPVRAIPRLLCRAPLGRALRALGEPGPRRLPGRGRGPGAVARMSAHRERRAWSPPLVAGFNRSRAWSGYWGG